MAFTTTNTNEHHGKKLREFLKRNSLSIVDFEKETGKSHGWTYKLLNSPQFNQDQVSLLHLTIGLDPKEYGYEKCKTIDVNGLSFPERELELRETLSKMEQMLAMYSDLLNQKSQELLVKDNIIIELKQKLKFENTGNTAIQTSS